MVQIHLSYPCRAKRFTGAQYLSALSFLEWIACMRPTISCPSRKGSQVGLDHIAVTHFTCSTTLWMLRALILPKQLLEHVEMYVPSQTSATEQVSKETERSEEGCKR